MPGPDSSAAPPDTTQYCNVILVYQEIPDRTRVFHLNLTVENLRRVSKLHNKYSNMVGNTDEEESELLWLYEFVQDKKMVFDSDYVLKHPLDAQQPYLMLNPCTVVVAGFLC